MTTSLATFLALTSDFQHACRTDDWHTVGSLLAEDATMRVAPLDMPLGGIYEGREASLFFWLARERLLMQPLGGWEIASIDAPTTHGDTTRCSGGARLASDPSGPRMFLELRITSEDGSVLMMVEDWTPESSAGLRGYLSRHGAARGVRTDAVDLFASEELALLTGAMERTERRVFSRSQISAIKSPNDLGKPIELQCSCSWTAPGLPPLSLQYGLRYRFGGGAALEVHELWEPEERRQLDAYLRAHRTALQKRAAERQDSQSRGDPSA